MFNTVPFFFFFLSQHQAKFKRKLLLRSAVPLSADEMSKETSDENSNARKDSFKNLTDIQDFEKNATASILPQPGVHKGCHEGPTIETNEEVRKYICKNMCISIFFNFSHVLSL